MRTGAIFARGSCRALKWLALAGVVFALGSAHATAQSTVSSGTYTPGSTMLEATLDGEVYGDPPLTAWTLSITGGSGTAPTVTLVDDGVPTAQSAATDELELTISGPIPTGWTVTLAYVDPGSGTNRLRSGESATLGNVVTSLSVGTLAEGDSIPVLPPQADAVHSANSPGVNIAIVPFSLMPATGGNGALTYRVADLPNGVTFTPLGPDGVAGGGDDLQIAGTPTAVTNGPQTVTVFVTDNDTGIAGGGANDSDSATFTITVTDVPATPAAPTVAATTNTSGSLDVSWTAPADNNSPIFDYEVQHRPMGAATWTHTTNLGTSTSMTFTGLTDGTQYQFQVRARSAVGWSLYSAIVTGTPEPSAARPDAPAQPTVATGSARGSLDVSWVAPADNGSAIIDYSLQYRVKGTANWTVMTAAITGTSTTLSGMPDGTTYEVQVRARNANGMSGWSPSGEGTTAAAPVTRTLRGQITEFKLIGAGEEKTIGGVKRLFVDEGEQDLELSVTVRWSNEEIDAIGYDMEQWVFVAIKENRAAGPPLGAGNWLSWIDAEGDVHFPQFNNRGSSGWGNLGGWVAIKTPKEDEIPRAERRSSRHFTPRTGKLPVLVLHDNHEAENDAFYIEAEHHSSANVDLDATAAVNKITPEVVIDDDEVQKLTVKGPTSVYESDGTAEFTLGADPRRVELPLDVVLEMLDLEGTTVSAAQISVSDASVQIGTGASAPKVTVHLPASDGNRVDDDYQMQASVNLYSLTAGGFDTIKVKSAPIKVLDVHKLPHLRVNPVSGTVAEGDEDGVELTLTVNRNPANTIATDPEKRQYTSEALTIAVTAGGSASSSDFTMTPSSISVPEYTSAVHRDADPRWTQSVKVKVTATKDEDIDAEMLTLGFVVNGTENADNGPRPSVDDGARSEDYEGSMAEATLTIQDATATLVSVRENAYDVIKGALGDPPMLTTGMSAELMGSNLFDYDSDAVSVAYATSVEGGAATASASGGTVTIMGAMAGEAKVTITATATPTASSLVVNQTKANVAQMTFPVMVEDEELVFMVAGPDDPNLHEGGRGGMVKVTTNRPVTANTEVMLMRDGSSSAGDDDYMLDPPLVTIMAGQMEGHTMVMATEDNMAEEMEMLTLFLVVDGMQMTDKSVSFNIWDAAVPALPIIAQLLLAAFLALGGYRRYLRR